MVNNSHTSAGTAIRELLDARLLLQPFTGNARLCPGLEQAKLMAHFYAKFDNCISVLSDLKARKSYIFYSSLAERLGISQQKEEINSIWEDELLRRIYAEDLQQKYRLELQFFKLLNSTETTERYNYEAIINLRVEGRNGQPILLKHRLRYISSAGDGNIALALCLYSADHAPGFPAYGGMIVNHSTGTFLDYSNHPHPPILSKREKEILRLIKQGHRSKEIAFRLRLSIHTINRHRQNIFQKLNATSAIEACSIAEAAGLL